MRVRVFETKWVEMKQAVIKRLEKLTQEQRCLACEEHLGDGTVVRGIHEKCYRATRRAISRGQFTEADRVIEGKLLPCQPRGPKLTNPVSIEASRSNQLTAE